MKIPGKPKEKQEYLNGINEHDFVYLVADILSFHFGHTDIKVMDGTGDGKRDIYSINKKGQKHLTQCKFHNDITKTCGSNETDELPIGLLKFGYSVGCFATSGKISPQGKREYLENYKNFELTWLDGIEIIEKVLETNLLKKIWFNGEKITKVVNSISIPFVIRKHLDDVNIEVDGNLKKSILAKFKMIEQRFSTKQFGNYRECEGKDKFYNVINGVNANAIIVENFSGFAQISELRANFLATIKQSFNLNEKEIIFVSFGYPFFSEIIDNSNKDLFNLPVSCETYIVTKNDIFNEYDWLINLSEDWILPTRCRSSMLDDFSFINTKNDTNLLINYLSKISNEHNASISLQVDFQKLIWRKSIFLFGFSKNIEKLITETRLIPDKQYDTEPDAKILCWFHPRPEFYTNLLNEVEKELFDEKFEQLKIYIKKVIQRCDIKEVTYEFAQKIAEISEPNLFNKNLVLHRTFDICKRYDEILSPIVPSNRSFIFRKIWKIPISKEIEIIIEKLIDKFKKDNCEFFIDYSQKTEQIEFIIVYLKYRFDEFNYLSTGLIIDKNFENVSSIFNEIEIEIKKYFKFAKSYTKQYLYEEQDIEFEYEND